MKKLILNIEESKFNAFVSFIRTLDYVSVSNEKEDIPSWQQEEVNRRIQLIESGEMNVSKWSDVKKQIFTKQ